MRSVQICLYSSVTLFHLNRITVFYKHKTIQIGNKAGGRFQFFDAVALQQDCVFPLLICDARPCTADLNGSGRTRRNLPHFCCRNLSVTLLTKLIHNAPASCQFPNRNRCQTDREERDSRSTRIQPAQFHF